MMRSRFWPSPLVLWLIAVLAGGVGYASVVKSDSIFPGDRLLMIGVGIIVLGGVIGSARTGRLFTWQGRIVPSKIEWLIGLTGATLFAAPIVRLLFVFLVGLVTGKVS